MRAGVNKGYFQYSELASNTPAYKFQPEDTMNYVTKLFNAYCAENGVQCTVTTDPKDFAQLFYFTNTGDRVVKITHLDQTRLLQPGESVMMKAANHEYALADQSKLPTIEAINPEVIPGWESYKVSNQFSGLVDMNSYVEPK